MEKSNLVRGAVPWLKFLIMIGQRELLAMPFYLIGDDIVVNSWTLICEQWYSFIILKI